MYMCHSCSSCLPQRACGERIGATAGEEMRKKRRRNVKQEKIAAVVDYVGMDGQLPREVFVEN